MLGPTAFVFVYKRVFLGIGETGGHPSSSRIPRIPLWGVLPELLTEGGVTQASWACFAWASPMALALPSPLPQLCAQGIPPLKTR